MSGTAEHPGDADTIAAARTALLAFRHYDVPGSLADLHDALRPDQASRESEA